MCLISKSKFPTIAKSNITVYKVLKSDFTSLYYFFPYELNKLYEENEDIRYDTHYRDVDVFSFSKNWIHSYTNKKIAKNYIKGKLILVKCIIPKGTMYHKDINNKEICSKKIKITEVCSPEIKII